MRVDKTVLPTDYNNIGDGIVYDEAWMRLQRNFVSKPTSGDESGIVEQKMTDLSYE